jgi:hypothetical protein
VHTHIDKLGSGSSGENVLPFSGLLPIPPIQTSAKMRTGLPVPLILRTMRVMKTDSIFMLLYFLPILLPSLTSHPLPPLPRHFIFEIQFTCICLILS